jgi:hypothetical protein
MRPIAFSFVTRPALQYFSTLSHKWHDFLKKKNCYYLKCVFCFSLHLCLKILLFISVHMINTVKQSQLMYNSTVSLFNLCL